MRAIIAVAITVAACAAIAACGSSETDSSTATHTTPPINKDAVIPAHGMRGVGGYLKSDGDNDNDDHTRYPSKEDQQEMVSAQRDSASPAETRTLTALVKRYFAAAAAGNGSAACQMLVPSLATATAASQHLPISDCATAMSHLFTQERKHLNEEHVATMTVTGVHVGGDAAFVTLGFRSTLETEVLLQREGHTWKMNALFDSTLP